VQLNSLPLGDLAREVVGEFAEAGGVAGAGAAVAADCCKESKALAIDPWDCLVPAALSAKLRPGSFKMLLNCELSRFPVCCC
jgi:hypothetical protein